MYVGKVEKTPPAKGSEIMKKEYLKEILQIGLPVTLQSILQASYSLVDQIMVGTLGTVSIAGGGLVGKFSSLVTFTLASIASVTSILVSQYHGSKDKDGISKSFFSCLYMALAVMALFMAACLCLPDGILSIYTTDTAMIEAAVPYFIVIAVSFLPMTLTMQFSALLRSIERSKFPLYAGMASMLLNVIFNYIFIFGKFGMPKLGLLGAGIGTLLSRTVECLVQLFFILRLCQKQEIYLQPVSILKLEQYQKIAIIVLPILFNEFSWSVGENIYAAIYGRIGTQAVAAMTLTNPLQGLFIGMFSGVSMAATVMTGKRLGRDETEEAYSIAKYLGKVGAIGSIIVSVILVVISNVYVGIYDVEPEVAETTKRIIFVLAIYLIVKIMNMIVAGGVLRSGGKTKYTLYIDLIGTWIFGVPLGLLGAFVFKWPIEAVYALLSFEEVVRLMITLIVFKKKIWMNNVTK